MSCASFFDCVSYVGDTGSDILELVSEVIDPVSKLGYSVRDLVDPVSVVVDYISEEWILSV